MFETQKAAEIDQSCEDFLILYAELAKSAREASGRLNSGQKVDMVRMRRLEARTDAAWAAVGQEKRDALTEMLFVRKLLPEEVREAMRAFDAQIHHLGVSFE